jgi:hypothetical protein
MVNLLGTLALQVHGEGHFMAHQALPFWAQLVMASLLECALNGLLSTMLNRPGRPLQALLGPNWEVELPNMQHGKFSIYSLALTELGGLVLSFYIL